MKDLKIHSSAKSCSDTHMSRPFVKNLLKISLTFTAQHTIRQDESLFTYNYHVCMLCLQVHFFEIMPEVKKNILNFGYRINFKFKGMLSPSFDRFYGVTKFILSSVNDLKFSVINFDESCDYLKEENGCNHNSKEYISDLRIYCRKIVPFVHYYKEQVSSYNHTVYSILMNEISLILPILLKDTKKKYNCIINNRFHRFGI